MSIRDSDLPEFSPAIRGYDRRQVDDYLRRLREYAMELEDRLRAVEAPRAGIGAEHPATRWGFRHRRRSA
jgi:hypothetical protein